MREEDGSLPDFTMNEVKGFEFLGNLEMLRDVIVVRLLSDNDSRYGEASS